MRLLIFLFSIIIVTLARASEITPNIDHSTTLLSLGFILVIAILSMSIHKLGQPAVLGQILLGCILSIPSHYHIIFFTALNHNSTLLFLAQLGSIFLLFDIGLESNFYEIKNTGKYSLFVSLTGVIIPFLTGYYLIAHLILHSTNLAFGLLIGGVLSVTSTGISITIFKELNLVKIKECQIVVAASIIDDILGLMLLAIVIAVYRSGSLDIKTIIHILTSSLIFFSLSFVIHTIFISKFIDRYLIKISRHYDMLPLTLVSLCILFAWASSYIGLSYTIGAFIAGLILDTKHFQQYDKLAPELPTLHLKISVSSLGKILTPIFFIYAGMQVDLIASINWQSLSLGLIISILAIISKSISGIFLPKAINKWLVGFSMIPRGEIGIIFAVTALQLKIINYELYTALLLMIIITSLITPIIINKLIKLLSY